MTITVTYPFDAYGSADECHIKDESHIVTTNDNTYRVIVPELAPFYNIDLSVIHIESELELREGLDYELVYRYRDLTTVTRYSLYGAIAIVNPELKGEFLVSYRTVGGEFVGIKSEVLTYLANTATDPLSVKYDNVEGVPVYFPPKSHSQGYSDFLTKGYLTQAIERLKDAVATNSDQLAEQMVQRLETLVADINADLNSYNQSSHIRKKNNPHQVTAAQVEALAEGGTAKDAGTIAGRDFNALVKFVLNRTLDQSDLTKYMRSVGEQLYSGDIKLAKNKGITAQTHDTRIEFTDNDLSLITAGLLLVLADYDRTSPTEHLYLRAGNNELKIVSSRDSIGDELSFTYNGATIITVGNVNKYMSEVLGPTDGINTNDSSNLSWEGNGLSSNPLKLNVSYDDATESKNGIVKLTSNINSTSITLAATPSVVSSAREVIEARVDINRRVNGRYLKNNISLTAEDFELENVDNTSEANKPLSDDQKQLLLEYANVGHTHDASEYDWEIASTSKEGMARLSTDISDVNDGVAATPATINVYKEAILDVATKSQGKLPETALDVKYWRSNEDITATGHTVTIPEGASFYINRVDYSGRDDITVPSATFKIDELYPNDYVNETFYIYVNVSNGVINYTIDKSLLSNTVGRLHVLTLYCTVDGIADMSTRIGSTTHLYNDNVDGIIVSEGVTSLGMFRELQEHIEDPDAHSHIDLTTRLGELGLDLIQNNETTDRVVTMSHDGLSDWNFYGTLSEFTLPIVYSRNDFTYLDGVVNQGTNVIARLSESIPGKFIMVNESSKFIDTEFKPDDNSARSVTYHISEQRASTSLLLSEVGVAIGGYVDDRGERYYCTLALANAGMVRFAKMKGDGSVVASKTLATIPIESRLDYPEHRVVKISHWNVNNALYYQLEIISDSFDSMGAVAVTTMTMRTDISDETVVDITSVLYDGNPNPITTRYQDIDVGIEVFSESSWAKALREGYVGLSFIPELFPESMVSDDVLAFNVDTLNVNEGGQDSRYLTAAGVYDAYVKGSNYTVVSGTAVDGAPIPLPQNFTYVDIYCGINTLGNSSNSDDPLDGIKVGLINSLTGDDITTTRLDMSTIDKHVSAICKYRNESTTSGSEPALPGVINYMAFCFRDY